MSAGVRKEDAAGAALADNPFRMAEDLKRLRREDERLLRQQAAVGNQAKRAKFGFIVSHGSQYASLLMGRTMRDAGVMPLMGAISSSWDNAVTESRMGCIKFECVYARTFDSREQAALEIFDYTEGS